MKQGAPAIETFRAPPNGQMYYVKPWFQGSRAGD